MNYLDKNFYKLTTHLSNLSYEEIFNNIKNNYLKIPVNTKLEIENFLKKFNYWGILDYQNNIFEEIENRAKSIYKHLNDFIWLYKKLKDYRSKKILYAILNNWYLYDFKELKECYDNQYPDYFDLDLVKINDNEIVVDLGAYTGDTIIDYLKMYNHKYKKIYCYEITDESFIQLKNNLSKYKNIIFKNKAVSDKPGLMYLKENEFGNQDANRITNNGTKKIEVVTIDKDITDKITMIKMDIEGFEYKALQGCKKHIKKNTPKLLISVYHNHEDIWKIPKLIQKIKPGYKFYLRYHGNNGFPTEVTLIAIYKE